MQNEWLRFNEKKISGLQHRLTELIFKNENPEIPYAEFRGMIGAAVVEIKKLQEKINELESKLKEKKDE